MCHADITPRTYEWAENSPYPVMTPTSKRECRNWDSIRRYSKNHQPSRTHGAVLENPTMGKFVLVEIHCPNLTGP